MLDHSPDLRLVVVTICLRWQQVVWRRTRQWENGQLIQMGLISTIGNLGKLITLWLDSPQTSQWAEPFSWDRVEVGVIRTLSYPWLLLLNRNLFAPLGVTTTVPMRRLQAVRLYRHRETHPYSPSLVIKVSKTRCILNEDRWRRMIWLLWWSRPQKRVEQVDK